jgi:hypothetical protein
MTSTAACSTYALRCASSGPALQAPASHCSTVIPALLYPRSQVLHVQPAAAACAPMFEVMNEYSSASISRRCHAACACQQRAHAQLILHLRIEYDCDSRAHMQAVRTCFGSCRSTSYVDRRACANGAGAARMVMVKSQRSARRMRRARAIAHEQKHSRKYTVRTAQPSSRQPSGKIL